MINRSEYISDAAVSLIISEKAVQSHKLCFKRHINMQQTHPKLIMAVIMPGAKNNCCNNNSSLLNLSTYTHLHVHKQRDNNAHKDFAHALFIHIWHHG